MSRVIGVDIGGTFTDLMLFDADAGSVHVHKVPSTPAAPDEAMVQGIRELCAQAGIEPGQVTGVFHGTTVATNAVLEFDGARVGMITTRGFRDVPHIGRHQRPQHYSVVQDIPWQARPFAQRRHRHVVDERIVPPSGEVLVPLDEDQVRAAARALGAGGVHVA
ncbi:MAG: ROK family protein [Gaiellales bacterium]